MSNRHEIEKGVFRRRYDAKAMELMGLQERDMRAAEAWTGKRITRYGGPKGDQPEVIEVEPDAEEMQAYVCGRSDAFKEIIALLRSRAEGVPNQYRTWLTHLEGAEVSLLLSLAEMLEGDDNEDAA